jgi:hypothetical protein
MYLKVELINSNSKGINEFFLIIQGSIFIPFHHTKHDIRVIASIYIYRLLIALSLIIRLTFRDLLEFHHLIL